jgi:hypothetical protein
MTEAEWLECTEPHAMLEFLGDKASDRKLRLFGVSCCRRVWHLLVDARSRHAVEMVEGNADGFASEEECNTARQAAILAIRQFDSWDTDPALEESYRTAAHAAALVGLRGEEGNVGGAARKAEIENAQHCEASNPKRPNWVDAAIEDGTWRSKYLRCIFGNPFRPVNIDPRWLTSTVVDLTTTIYDERAFEQMPILADALMDAGCVSEEIIGHCRGEGPHVRGCWVIDRSQGRSRR